MRSKEHQEAVSRRLALLDAELRGLNTGRGIGGVVSDDGDDSGDDSADGGDQWWADHTRVNPLRAPGRHVAREMSEVHADPAVEDTGFWGARWRGPVALGPAHVAVIAVIVALGALMTAVIVVRSDDRPATPTVAEPVEQLVNLSGAEATSDPTSEPAPVSPSSDQPEVNGTLSATSTVTVDVAGKVKRPGIAVLDEGARVADALEAAGGARNGVDLSTLNLARVLVDGEQILVGRPAAMPAPAPNPGTVPAPDGTAPSGAAAAPPLVNLNQSDTVQLETLPQVGPVTAAAIIAWRDANGGFTAIEQLIEVDGIGEVTMARLAPLVTI